MNSLNENSSKEVESLGFVSADCHVQEPGDLFRTRMDKKYRDRAPGDISKEDSDYYVMDGMPDQPLGIKSSGLDLKLEDEIKKGGRISLERPVPRAYHAVERQKDIMLDKVVAAGSRAWLSLWINFGWITNFRLNPKSR